jgi:hypothetical protein
LPPKETTIVLMWAKRSSPKMLLQFLDAFVHVLPQSCSHTSCDRTTSKMRGLSPKIISGDYRLSKNTQTHAYKHTTPYLKFKLKLLQIKCHVLEFTKDESQKMLQKIIRVFAEAFFSHDRHTLFILEESGPPRMTYTCESQSGTQPSSVCISHWQPSSASPEGGRSSPAHKYIKITRAKAWATTLNRTYPSWSGGHEF